MEKSKHGILQRWLLFALYLAVVFVCGITFRSLQVLAAEGDTSDEALSLAVELTYEGEVLEGVEVYTYYIGSWSGTGLVLEGDFANLAITTVDGEVEDADWDALALTLSGYVYLNSMKPDEKVPTDANGDARFPLEGETLKEGVYLVLTQTFYISGSGIVYTIQPFLVWMPGAEGNEVIYHVVAIPKIASRIGAQRITVLKIWDDSDSASRPESVEVTLVSGLGEVWETVTLSEENSWRYTFTGLPEDTSWYVVEDVPDGYTVLETADGNTIALTNTLIEEEQGTTPQEDDTTASGEDDTTASEEEGTSAGQDEGTTTASAEDTTTAEGNTTTLEDDTTTDSDGGAGVTGGEDETTTEASSSSTEDETTTVLTNLPQTGTLWWAVPILACCGMVSVLIGVAKKRGQEEDN